MTIYKRLFVFWIFMYTCLSTEGVYLGCYQDDKDNRVLERALKDSKTNTPAECLRRCSDYRYAGVEFTTKCFCGNTLNHTPQLDEHCQHECPGDSNSDCGDWWMISVYTNWACGPPPIIANGIATLRKGTNITYGTIADVFCKPGFISTTTITCLSNTSWEKATCNNQSATTSSPVTPPTSSTQTIRTTVTTTTTRATSLTTTQTSTVQPASSTTTNHSQIISTSTTNVQTSGTIYISRDTATTTTKATSLLTASSPKNTRSTTSVSAIDGQSAASKQQASQGGSTTTAVAAGVSVTVALAVAAVVIVLVLRNKKQSCFANTKRSGLDNRDDDNHISLQNDVYHAPGAPVLNHTYSGIDTGNRISEEHEASPFTDVTCQYTNSKHEYHVSEDHTYCVVEKDGFELQRNAANSTPTDVHDYFVLEKQQPNFGNRNCVSTNEVHPYFVLEKEGDPPVHNRPPNEANPYFVLEKQNTGNPQQIHTTNALALENTDGDMYQEIVTDDTYAGIDDSREDNNDYDYTNKAFKDSRTDISDNVYNHLNTAGNEYDHLGKGQSNNEAMENNYDVTSSAV